MEIGILTRGASSMVGMLTRGASSMGWWALAGAVVAIIYTFCED